VNLRNGKAELVTVTDRGPNLRFKDRIIDLSEAAATSLGYVDAGLTPVFLFPVVVVDPETAKITASLRDPGAKDGSQSSEVRMVVNLASVH
jgi:rare lipoprotein A